MLHRLPPELVLDVLSRLSIPSIRSLKLVCRLWNEFIDTQESHVYHNAALKHGFVGSADISVDEAKSPYPKRSMKSVDGWKTFCQRRFCIERGWLGRNESSVIKYDGTGLRVHRLKVDEEAGYLIATSRVGGLVVADLDTNRALWSLNEEYVAPRAHCEYGQGFLIFNRSWESIDVWRRTHDFGEDELPRSSRPDERQYRASIVAAALHPSDNQRGHFRPWARIDRPDGSYAFRFVFPTLVIVGERDAQVWNVLSGCLMQTIEDINRPLDDQSMGPTRYVEVNDHYVFICGFHHLRVFSRLDGHIVYHMKSGQLSCAHWKLDLRPKRIHDVHDGVKSMLLPQATRMHDDFKHLYDYSASTRNRFYEPHRPFQAVHVSGPDMVVAGEDEKLIVIPDFERVIRGEIDLVDAALEIDTYSRDDSTPYISSVYLAFENGRVALATLGGIFVITLNDHVNQLGIDNRDLAAYPRSPKPRFPGVSVCRVRGFNNWPVLKYLSCLQLTDTGLFFTHTEQGPWPEDVYSHYQRPPLSSAGAFQLLPHANGVAFVDEEEDVNELQSVANSDFSDDDDTVMNGFEEPGSPANATNSASVGSSSIVGHISEIGEDEFNTFDAAHTINAVGQDGHDLNDAVFDFNDIVGDGDPDDHENNELALVPISSTMHDIRAYNWTVFCVDVLPREED